MGKGFALVEPGMGVQEMRAAAAAYLRAVAGAAFTPMWGWSEAGMWIPDDDPAVAADEARALFDTACEDEPAYAEVLWRAPGEDAPAWWRTAITATGHGDSAWLRGQFTDPRTEDLDLADVVAVLPLPPTITSCLGAGRDGFVSSPLRRVPEPDALVPQVEITEHDAEVLATQWVHWSGHRVGPLYPVCERQAFACQVRLFDLTVAAVQRGPRTSIDAVAFTEDVTVPCPSHELAPVPGYVHGADAHAAGVRAVAHPHHDGRMGVETNNIEQLFAVLGTVAQFGGTLHLTTTDPAAPEDAPPIADTLYVVHRDLRPELVEDDRAREITALNRLAER